MKNILKISLLITLLAVAFILLGSTNVNAAADDLVFKTVTVGENASTGRPTFTPTDTITELNFGNIIFGNPAQIYFAITNTTGSNIIIDNSSFGSDTDHFTFSKVSSYDGSTEVVDGGLQINANYSRIFKIDIATATESNFGTRKLDTKLTFVTRANGTFELNITGDDLKKSLGAVETPVINPNDLLTYNGIEQTMDFYTYNGTDYTLVDFNAADSMYTITGNTATTAGTYTAQITLKNPTLYKWDDSLSANLSGANNETYSIEWEMQQIITPLPGEQEGIVDNTLQTISLPDGWVWNAPNTKIKVGVHGYAATFNHPENNPNYATINGQIAVNGKNQYSISFNLTSNSTVDALQNPDYLMEGDTKTYTLSTESGYLFTSIKINGIEQLSNGAVATRFPINITNIDKDYVINAETEQIKFSPMEGYEGLTCHRYTDKTLQIKWDLDFDNFEAASVKINGKNIYKGFKFLSGSVILELDSTVLASLSLGENKIEIELASGELAVATFNLIDSFNNNSNNNDSNTNANANTNSNNNPETGDNIVTYTIIGLVSIICITGIIIIRKKLNK